VHVHDLSVMYSNINHRWVGALAAVKHVARSLENLTSLHPGISQLVRSLHEAHQDLTYSGRKQSPHTHMTSTKTIRDMRVGCSWVDLPEDVLLKVLFVLQVSSNSGEVSVDDNCKARSLHKHDDIGSIHASSSAFRAVCGRWRDVHDRWLENLSPSEVPRHWCDRGCAGSFPSVRTIRLGSMKQSASSMLRNAAFRWPNLTDVDLTGSFANDKAVEVVGRLRHLRRLKLEGCSRVTRRGVRFLAALSALTSLDLGGCYEVTDKCMWRISRLSALETLRLAGCRQVTDLGLRALGALPALTSLDLSRFNQITDEGALVLGRGATSLTSLQLTGCNKLSDAGLSELSGMAGLTSLDLTGCVRVRGTSLRALSSNLTALTHLNLSGWTRLSEAALEELCILRRMKCLHLASCGGVTGQGLSVLGRLPVLSCLYLGGRLVCDGVLQGIARLKCLTSLHLQNCSNVTDKGLASLAGHPCLAALDLSCSDAVSDEGLMVLSTLSTLSRLHLGGCTQVTDEGAKCLQRLTRLTCLDVSCCKKVSDEGLLALSSLTSLTSLNLEDCNRVTDVGVGSLGSLWQLTSLDLSCCYEVTDQGLCALRRLERLSRLRLTGCNMVTQEGRRFGHWLHSM